MSEDGLISTSSTAGGHGGRGATPLHRICGTPSITTLWSVTREVDFLESYSLPVSESCTVLLAPLSFIYGSSSVGGGDRVTLVPSDLPV